MQRVALIFALLVVAGLGLWTWLGNESADAPPPGPQPPKTATDGTKVAPPEQGDVRTPGTAPVTPSPTPAPIDPPPTPAPPARPPNVVLVVRDVAARTMVPEFRWRFRNSLATERGTGNNGRAELSLAPSANGELLVEADGFAPWTRDLTAPTPPAPASTVDVFLSPAMPAAGITLHVHDLSLRAVPHVRVDAFALTAESPPTGWQLGQALWARRAGAADGRYVLPTLAPGTYGIRVVATDEQGGLLPLLPFLHTYTLTGSNGFVEDVPLEPGALLALELFDATGNPYDPVRMGTATLGLRLTGGPRVQRKWISAQQGVEASAIDVLPGAGKVMLAEALPGGHYTLEVFVNGEPRVSRALLVRAGLPQTERVDVP